jgi:uncharacterized protein YraI
MTYLIDTNIFILLLKSKGRDGWRISDYFQAERGVRNLHIDRRGSTNRIAK